MEYQAYQGVQVEVTAPSAALVVGFPLLLMLVMLLMNAVERRLTGSARSGPGLRLVPGGVEETDTADSDSPPAPPATAAGAAGPAGPAAPAVVTADRPAAPGPRHTLRLTPPDLVTAHAFAPAATSRTTAAHAFAPATATADTAEAGVLPTTAEAF